MKNESVLLANKVQQGTSWAVDFDNQEGAGCTLTLDVTNVGTGSLSVAIVGITPQGTTYTIITTAAVVGNGQVQLKVGRGLPVAANISANDQLPRKLRVTFTHNNANPMDYTAGLALHG